MTRYRRSPPRARTAARKSRSSSFFFSGPFVAFILVASLGIFFVGCGGVKGPNDRDTMEDTTFTAEDMERFRLLSGSGAQMATGSDSTESEGPVVDLPQEEAATAQYPAIDPALARTYEAVRAMPDVSGSSFRVVNDFLNVRAEPNTGAASVGRFENGQAVDVVEFVNADWAKVRLPNGTQGYAANRYLAKPVTEESLAQNQKAYEELYFVNFAFVNVRAQPNTSSEKLGQIPGRSFVRPVGMQNGWARVSFEGKEGYASMQFLAPFMPTFLVRQNTFRLPILHYHADQPGMLDALKAHAQALREQGVTLITLRDLYDLLLAQEQRDIRLQPKRVVIAVSGLTPQNVREVSTALRGIGVPATFFLQTKDVGISGISEKQILTLLANGFDVQSAGHTGDDLRGLTTAQIKLELAQSRTLLQDMTNRTVFAILYPLGGVNDRVIDRTQESGYLMGLSGTPDSTFSRDQLLRMPSITVTSSMTAEDIVRTIQ